MSWKGWVRDSVMIIVGLQLLIGRGWSDSRLGVLLISIALTFIAMKLPRYVG